MLKALFAVSVTLLFPLLLEAQIHRAYTRPEPVWGIMLKGAGQLSSFADSENAASYKMGWNAGLGLKVPLRNAWWLQPELLYNEYKAGLQYQAGGGTDTYEATYSFTYISFPLLLAYRPSDIIEFHLGPQVGTLFRNDVKTTVGSQSFSISPNELNRWEFAAAVGVELNVSPLAFGARYTYGFSEVAESGMASSRIGRAKLQGLQLYGALVF